MDLLGNLNGVDDSTLQYEINSYWQVKGLTYSPSACLF